MRQIRLALSRGIARSRMNSSTSRLHGSRGRPATGWWPLAMMGAFVAASLTSGCVAPPPKLTPQAAPAVSDQGVTAFFALLEARRPEYAAGFSYLNRETPKVQAVWLALPKDVREEVFCYTCETGRGGLPDDPRLDSHLAQLYGSFCYVAVFLTDGFEDSRYTRAELRGISEGAARGQRPHVIVVLMGRTRRSDLVPDDADVANADDLGDSGKIARYILDRARRAGCAGGKMAAKDN